MDHTAIRIHHTSESTFARTPHEVTEDERLSWNAKGILTYLLGKPPGWKVREKDIQNHGKDGIRAVRSGLKELRTIGYAKLTDIRDEKGRLVEWVWEIADAPIFRPDTRNAHVDNAHVENAYPSKNEGSKNQERNNESKGSKETSFASQADENVSFPPLWIPDTRTKEQKLASIQPRRKFPSQIEFEGWLQSGEVDGILCHRDDLYRDLCERKWHHWNDRSRKWSPIRDWKKYVLGLNEKIEERTN